MLEPGIVLELDTDHSEIKLYANDLTRSWRARGGIAPGFRDEVNSAMG
jgi:hypothetical protein